MQNTSFLNQNGSQPDTLAHGTAADGMIRCIAAVTTNTVKEAAERHKTAPTATAALGRTLTGALLLGATYKDFDRLTVKIDGDGLIDTIVAEANPHGGVRGYVDNPAADVPLNAQGKFDVRGVVGSGFFYVIREQGYDIGLYKEPYRGSVPIVSGEIGEDFAYYLLKSEQLPSAVMLGVLVNPARDEVLAAGGVIIQMMPGAPENTITEIERAILESPSTTALISEGARPADLLKFALGNVDFEILEEKPIGFECTCSRERVVRIISSIDRAEVESMLREDKGAVLHCHFCNSEYRLSGEDLEKILEERD
ncbi:MAG TPA: Hsp33 family molecular chaperone HslO [Pyrinomonadaceae bacterium]|jgi:molecular chaperone Hsp33